MWQTLLRAMGWPFRRPGYLLLTAAGEDLARQDPARFARAWAGLAAQSVIWGLVLLNVWWLAWTISGDIAPYMVPAAATLAVFALWPFRRAVVALADVCAPGESASRPVVAAVLVAGMGMCLAKLFGPSTTADDIPLPWWLAWVRPWALYRVLLLMPMWGAWSMLITPQYCRSRRKADPATAAFAKGCSPLAAAGCLLLPLAGTLFYFHYLGTRAQVVISAVAGATAIAAGVACSRRAGGLCRQSLLAANLITQLAFLLACLACMKS